MKAQVSHRFSQVRPELSLLVALFGPILGEHHKREGKRQWDAKNLHGKIRGSDGCQGERYIVFGSGVIYFRLGVLFLDVGPFSFGMDLGKKKV